MMWMLLTAAPLAQSQLGYPIFVRAERGRCTFQIQDMIMSRGSDVRGWMSGLDYKGRQIDIGQHGFSDARIAPRGNMSPEDCIYWTWAIENVD